MFCAEFGALVACAQVTHPQHCCGAPNNDVFTCTHVTLLRIMQALAWHATHELYSSLLVRVAAACHTWLSPCRPSPHSTSLHLSPPHTLCPLSPSGAFHCHGPVGSRWPCGIICNHIHGRCGWISGGPSGISGAAGVAVVVVLIVAALWGVVGVSHTSHTSQCEGACLYS